MASWHARRALRWWRGLVEARALVARVLQRAQACWDAAADAALVFGTQFQLLHQVGCVCVCVSCVHVCVCVCGEFVFDSTVCRAEQNVHE